MAAYIIPASTTATAYQQNPVRMLRHRASGLILLGGNKI
jgi:hypothetical protein